MNNQETNTQPLKFTEVNEDELAFLLIGSKLQINSKIDENKLKKILIPRFKIKNSQPTNKVKSLQNLCLQTLCKLENINPKEELALLLFLEKYNLITDLEKERLNNLKDDILLNNFDYNQTLDEISTYIEEMEWNYMWIKCYEKQKI